MFKSYEYELLHNYQTRLGSSSKCVKNVEFYVCSIDFETLLGVRCKPCNSHKIRFPLKIFLKTKAENTYHLLFQHSINKVAYYI